jgi:hypothetical protein
MEPVKDLFAVSVNPSGKEWIKRLAKLIKWIIVFGILMSLIELIGVFVRLFYLQPLLNGNSLLEISSLSISYWMFIYIILLLIQIFLFRRTAKALSFGINANDEETLNKAFRHLYYYAFFGLIGLIGGVFIAAFDVFVSFKYYKLF